MKEIEFNNQKYNLPENWGDVKWFQYLKIQDLKEDLGVQEKLAQVVSILTGIDIKLINDAEPRLVHLIFDELGFLKEQPKVKEITGFTIGSDIFIVNGLVDSKFKEFAMFEKYDSNYKETPLESVIFKLGVMCRKAGEDLDQIQVEQRANLFSKNLNVETVNSIAAFFLINQLKSVNLSLQSLAVQGKMEKVNMMKQELQEYLHTSTKNSGGIHSHLKKVLLKSILYLIEKPK